MFPKAQARALVVLAVGLLTSGCAQQLNRIETRIDELARDQQQAATQQGKMAQDLGQLRSALDEEGLSGQERRAELQERLASIERNVARLLAQSEEQQSLLVRLRATLDLLERESPGTLGGEQTPAPATSAPAPGSGSAGAGSTGREVFDAAFADFTRGNYTLAREGFNEVLSRFSGSELADDAAYWIAETYYAQGDYVGANERFADVLQRYPQGDTLPAALLKMGYCEIELGNQSKAAQIFRQLKNDYPNSDEAMIAEHKLSTLRGTP